MIDKNELFFKFPILKEMEKNEIIWINPDKKNIETEVIHTQLTMTDIEDAEARLQRFAPFIMKCFPETIEQNGLIESVLTPIPKMHKCINSKYDASIEGQLLLKQDSHLAIAGSVKARGGIYEVLKHTEDLALEAGIICKNDNYVKLAEQECQDFFSNYTIQVGSTGNLGLSIGIMSAAIGYKVVVHMSADARQWKKDLLRSKGVTVIEYDADYSQAVKEGRRLSNQNPKSYFVDDENSKDLFLGYAVAAKRLVVQLKEKGIVINENHPLFVYIPCGVGGAPGGITFGLKQIFGNHVHCFFVEPMQAPCMAVGMITGLNNKISVQDIGLSGISHADGLAVGRASGFVGEVMRPMLSGEFTIEDAKLYDYMRDLLETESIFLEPSACAAFHGPAMMKSEKIRKYLKENNLQEKMEKAVHIVWATGGNLVPEEIRKEYMKTYL